MCIWICNFTRLKIWLVSKPSKLASHPIVCIKMFWSIKVQDTSQTRWCGDVSHFATVEPTMSFFKLICHMAPFCTKQSAIQWCEVMPFFQIHSLDVTTLHQTTSHTNTRRKLDFALQEVLNESCSNWCHLVGKTHYSVSQKKIPPGVLWHFPKRLGIFSPNFTHLLNVPVYTGLKFFI